MIKEYNLDSERKYTAPEAPLIVEPETMIHKWIKDLFESVKVPILVLAFAYLSINTGDFFMTNGLRKGGMSKSEIEELIDKNLNDKTGLGKFILDDLTKPGRELAYLIHKDKKQ